MGRKTKVLFIAGAAAIGVITLLVVLIVLTASGVLSATPETLVFTSYSGVFTYDGQEHTSDGWALTEGELQEGHTAAATVTGSQTDAGSSANYFTVTITDEKGANVTSDYNIEYKTGTLTVEPYQISIATDAASKYYDGTPLTADGYALVSVNGLLDGDSMQVNVYGSQTDAGESENSVDVLITNAEGKDVTKNYDIGYDLGTLKVYARSLTVRSYGAVKEYDGTPLTNNEYTIVSATGLLDGHIVEVAISGSQLAVGTSENTIADVAVYYIDGNGGKVYVTQNYDITCENGELVVTGDEMKLDEGNNEVSDGGYSFTADLDGTYTFTADGLDSLTITDGLGNVLAELLGGGSIDLDLKAGDELSVEVTGEGSLDIDSILDLAEGLNGITDGSYSFTADEDGTYSFTADGADITITDGNGNVLAELGDGETFDIDLSAGEGVSVEVSGDGSLDIDSTLDLSEGLNGVTEGSYSFTADADGTYSFTAGGSDVTIKDENGNVLAELSDGDTADIDLSAGEEVTVEVSGDGAIDIDSTLDLAEGVNGVTEGSYSFTADEDGTYLFTADGADITIKDENGNVLAELGDGDTADIELSAGDEIIAEVTGDGSLGIGTGSGGSIGLDTSGTISAGGAGSGDDVTAFEIYSDVSGSLYLKIMSYGDYSGSAWGSAAEYGYTIDGCSMDYLLGTALANSYYALSDVQIKNYTIDYLLPYYMSMSGGSYTVQTSDVAYSGTESEYSLGVYYYDYKTSGLGGIYADSSYSAVEAAYYSYVQANYTSVPAATLAYLNGIISDNGFDGITDTYTLVCAVASYIQNAATYNLSYDSALDSEEDIVVAFLDTYKEGVCQHYASAATLLYRALGIPARYTVGYSAYTVAGEWTEISTGRAHAWVEVYIQGYGWVNVEVTGGSSAGGSGETGGGSGGSGDTGGSGGSGGSVIDPTKPTYTLAPSTAYYQYEDGMVISYAGTTLTGFSGLAELGYTYTFTASGSLGDWGHTETVITSLIIYYGSEEDGNIVYSYTGGAVTYEEEFGSDYTIILKNGTMYVYLYELKVTTDSAEKVYDGTALTAAGYTCTGLYDGHYAVVTTSGSITNAGSSANGYTITIYDENGSETVQDGRSVREMYYIRSSLGTLKVTPCGLTVTAGSVTKSYAELSGGALTYEGTYTYTVDGEYNGEYVFAAEDGETVFTITGTDDDIPEGYVIEVTISGSQSKRGRSDNKVSSVKIYDGEGNDVTSCFAVTSQNGTLKVTN